MQALLNSKPIHIPKDGKQDTQQLHKKFILPKPQTSSVSFSMWSNLSYHAVQTTNMLPITGGGTRKRTLPKSTIIFL